MSDRSLILSSAPGLLAELSGDAGFAVVDLTVMLEGSGVLAAPLSERLSRYF